MAQFQRGYKHAESTHDASFAIHIMEPLRLRPLVRSLRSRFRQSTRQSDHEAFSDERLANSHSLGDTYVSLQDHNVQFRKSTAPLQTDQPGQDPFGTCAESRRRLRFRVVTRLYGPCDIKT